MNDLVGGELVTQVRAPGNPPSDTVAPFTVLNLDLQPELPDNVEDISGCITRFTGETTLEGDGLQRCLSPTPSMSLEGKRSFEDFMPAL